MRTKRMGQGRQAGGVNPDGWSLAAVRLQAREMAPHLAPALYAVRFQATPGLRKKSGGWACDKYWRVYYDPIVLKTETLEALAADLIHEIWHILRHHFARWERLLRRLKGKLSMKQLLQRWNKSADAAINDDPRLEKFLQEWCIFAQNYGLPKGQTAEWYFENWPEDDGDDGDDGDDESDGPACDCGSGAGGPPREWDLGDPNGEGGDPASGIGEAEGVGIRAAVAEEISKAVSRGVGNLSHQTQEWAKKTLTPPKIPWTQQFSRILRSEAQRSAGQDEYDFRRPHPLSAQIGIIMPSLYRPELKVSVVLDNSGSMSWGDRTDKVLAELDGILRATGAEVTLFTCSSRVGKKQRISSVSRVLLDQSGGTDMRVGIQAALEAEPKPHVIVVLTDGETAWPDSRLPCPMIACLAGASESWKARVPAWGRMVSVD